MTSKRRLLWACWAITVERLLGALQPGNWAVQVAIVRRWGKSVMRERCPPSNKQRIVEADPRVQARARAARKAIVGR